jgi:hypothetical protein
MGIALAGTRNNTAVPTEIKKGVATGGSGVSPGMGSGTFISSLTNFSEVAEGLGIPLDADSDELPKSNSETRDWQNNQETNDTFSKTEPVTLDMESDGQMNTRWKRVRKNKETGDATSMREMEATGMEQDGSMSSNDRWTTKNKDGIGDYTRCRDGEISDGYYERHKVRATSVKQTYLE